MKRTITVGALWRLVLALSIAAVIHTTFGTVNFEDAFPSVYWSAIFAMLATLFSEK
jgi:hypothetical protein